MYVCPNPSSLKNELRTDSSTQEPNEQRGSSPDDKPPKSLAVFTTSGPSSASQRHLQLGTSRTRLEREAAARGECKSGDSDDGAAGTTEAAEVIAGDDEGRKNNTPGERRSFVVARPDTNTNTNTTAWGTPSPNRKPKYTSAGSPVPAWKPGGSTTGAALGEPQHADRSSGAGAVNENPPESTEEEEKGRANGGKTREGGQRPKVALATATRKKGGGGGSGDQSNHHDAAPKGLLAREAEARRRREERAAAARETEEEELRLSSSFKAKEVRGNVVHSQSCHASCIVLDVSLGLEREESIRQSSPVTLVERRLKSTASFRNQKLGGTSGFRGLQ